MVHSVPTPPVDPWNLERARSALPLACGRSSSRPDALGELSAPREAPAATQPIRMDEGSRRAFKALRCRCDERCWPATGGERFRKAVSLGHVEALAFRTGGKCAVGDRSYGGAGSFDGDAEALSRLAMDRRSLDVARPPTSMACAGSPSWSRGPQRRHVSRRSEPKEARSPSRRRMMVARSGTRRGCAGC